MRGLSGLPRSVVAFIDELKARPEVVRLAIFGSRAVGDNAERADVDLAVYAPSVSRRQFARIRVDAYEANTAYWVSPVHYDRMLPELQVRVDQQGVVIYARGELPEATR